MDWKILEDSINNFSTVVLENDSDEEDCGLGNEYRPENVKIAKKLLLIFKEYGNGHVPTVHTFPDGSIRFRWTNRQTLSAVTCSIRVEEKEREVDISKYVIGKDSKFTFFPFSPFDEESIGKTLLSFLQDAF